MPRVETREGDFLDLLPVGSKVTHMDHPELRGRIVRHEYASDGSISPLPYAVHWTDNQQAFELLGSITWLYPDPSKIIPVPVDEALKPE